MASHNKHMSNYTSIETHEGAVFSAPEHACTLGVWLIIVTVFLVAMIVVGGATRLTDSGLSITEWKPVTGALPPLNAAAWDAEFEKYRQIPEYKQQNLGMSLDEFKSIYRWEWGHRLLGRLIGFVVLIPMGVFAYQRRINARLGRRLGLLLALGAVQGAIGWWMVSSGLGGLEERLDVSAYRLAIHLGMALLLLGLSYWTVLDVRQINRAPIARPMRALAFGFLGLILVQAILGGFVAGNDGGYVHNSWPLMSGHWLPVDYDVLNPYWRNFIENPAAAQFNHRIGAYLVFACAIGLAGIAWRTGNAVVRRVGGVILLLVGAQVVLGIWTLLAVTPLPLGIAHQALGAMVFLSAVHLAHFYR